MGASCILQQSGVDISNQAETERKVIQFAQAPIHGVYIIYDLANIVPALIVQLVILSAKDIDKGCLCSFNLRTQNGFFFYIHCDEQFRIRQNLRDSIEAA